TVPTSARTFCRHANVPTSSWSRATITRSPRCGYASCDLGRTPCLRTPLSPRCEIRERRRIQTEEKEMARAQSPSRTNRTKVARVISVHEYDLKPGSDPQAFEFAVRRAEAGGLLKLPGLLEHYLVKGRKGIRRDQYAAVWIYESRTAWERLWGTPENPRAEQDYPETWKRWEREILAPFLVNHPDAIRFTTYEELPQLRESDDH